MPVPLLDVNAQNLPLEEEFKAAFERILHSGRFIMGEEVERFEEKCAEFLEVEHAIGISSGTDAILVALMAMGIGPGDEVICPSFTFFATAGCVARVGATPVFVDCCPVCFNLELSSAADAVTSATKAIIPVHLFGQATDMNEVCEFAKKHQLAVIEDAAQSFGARYRGKTCGTFGEFGTYSFFPSKNLGGLGDSGLLVTNDEQLATRARQLRNHGMEPKYHHHDIGGNFRIDPLQAAMLSIKLDHYANYTAGRKRHAAHYIDRLSSYPWAFQASESDCCCLTSQTSRLPTETQLILPTAYTHNEHIWNQFTLRVRHGRRDALRQHLGQRQIGCETYYPVPMHQQPCFSGLPIRLALPVTEQLASEVLSIPVYPELSSSQLSEVTGAIVDFFDAK